jgi:hypothetical protein
MFAAFLHADSVATSGATSVVVPLLVFAGEPAKRSAFSQSTMPDQLSMKTLSATRKLEP